MTHEWQRVTRAEPCEVCKKPDYCTFCPELNLIQCMRVESNRPSRCSLGGWFHDLERNVIRPVTRIPVRPKPVTIDAAAIWKRWDDNASCEQVAILALELRVGRKSLRSLGCCWAPEHGAWAFPMRSGDGTIIGIRLRDESGKKWAVTGSHAGLFYADSNIERRVYICEGTTDAAAALSMGLYAIGRHSCSGGHDQMNIALKRLGTREAIIIADNGDPGINGAQRLAAELDVANCILVPPAKDLREALALGMTADLLECMVKDLIWNIPQNKSGQPNGLG